MGGVRPEVKEGEKNKKEEGGMGREREKKQR